ncbi:bifunctional molybdenum cofactor biosynthesis protein MoaC/MoaB [Paracoccaceae bacterium GXU_MW_L88]
MKDAFEIGAAKGASLRMIDVGRKRPTRRRAVACGSITMGAEAWRLLRAGQLPKGDVLTLAEAAGIMGAKNAPDLMPMCHPLPLDSASIDYVFDDEVQRLTVYGQAAAVAKTGVEMEALAATNAALLTIWDLTKGIDPALEISGVRLLVKTGGKSGVWVNPEGIPDWLSAQLPDDGSLEGRSVALLTASDRAAAGEYLDESGALLANLVEDAGGAITAREVVADSRDGLKAAILALTESQPDLLIISGGTGPGPRDNTPETLAEIAERMLDGFGEMLRTESQHHIETAWLSRMTAGMVGRTLVLAFPGSPKAVKECWDIVAPFIGVTLTRIAKQGFGSK